MIQRPRLIVVYTRMTRVDAVGRSALLLADACSELFDVTLYTTEAPSDAGHRTRTIPAPKRPLFLRYVVFLLIANILVARSRRENADGLLVVGLEGCVLRPDVSYNHMATRFVTKNDLVEYEQGMRGWVQRANLRVHAVMEGFALSAARLVVAPSEGTLAALLVPPVTKAVAIPNVITSPGSRSSHRADKNPGAALRIAFVAHGRLAHKGLHLVIQALSAPLLVDKNIELYVLGPTSSATKPFRDLCRRSGIEDRVHWLGPVKDVSTALRGMDVLCMASIYESFSMVLAEAVMADLIVVSTVTHGVAEELDRVGAMIRVERTSDDIARGVVLAMNLDGATRNTMVTEGKLAVSLLTEERFKLSWISAMRTLLGQS